MIEVKAVRTFIRTYSLFKSERVNVNIKLNLHKVMTYAYTPWVFAADIHPLKLQRLEAKFSTPLEIFRG
jgi:hypothetical protein